MVTMEGNPNETPAPLNAKEKQALKEQWQQELDKLIEEFSALANKTGHLEGEIDTIILNYDSENRLEQNFILQNLQNLKLNIQKVPKEIIEIKQKITDHLKKEPK